MVSAWVPNKYYELTGTPLRAPCSIRLRECAPTSKKGPREGRRYPGYVEIERNADDSSREKNEPIGLNRAYLARHSDLPA